MTTTLLTIRALIADDRPLDAIRLIDAALGDDPEAMIDARLHGKTPLTGRQKDVYRWIIACREKSGKSPTLQEIADEMGIAKVSVFEHVRELERKRVVAVEKHRARGIRIL